MATPKTGPILYLVRESQGLVITGGTTAAPMTFRFPRAVFVTGFQLVPLDGQYPTLARLSTAILDEVQNEMIGNWFGETGFPNLAMQGRNGIGGPGPLLAIGGPTAFFPIQRPVLDGDQWRISLTAGAGADVTIAALGFTFEEGLRRG